MDNQARKCCSCGGQMSPIKIIDKQGTTPESSGFEYAEVGAQRGFWSGAYPKSGKLDSYLCQDCGAVGLFAIKSL